MTGRDFGLNIDGNGYCVGLWFNPDRVDQDGYTYVRLTPEELSDLAASIEAYT